MVFTGVSIETSSLMAAESIFRALLCLNAAAPLERILAHPSSCWIHMRTKRRTLYRSLAVLAVLAFAQVVNGYSVLTHEQIVDLAWKDQLAPLLLKRFPGTTAEELRKAHAFAYGGGGGPGPGAFSFRRPAIRQ